jgi:hypothetical protein
MVIAAEESEPAIGGIPEAQTHASAPLTIEEERRPRRLTLYALFLAVGLIAFGYAWMNVHRRSVVKLSSAGFPIRAHAIITHWVKDGYFASYGMLWPTPDEKIIYSSFTGGFMITGFLTEKVWMAVTGKYSWRLLALHNLFVALLTSALLALLAYRLALRFGLEPLHAFILGVAAQMVWFTFPDNLATFWELPEQTFCLFAAIGFLLLEERALDGRTRLLTAMQALAIFALCYIEYVTGLMFITAYLMTVLLLREERPPLRRLCIVLLLPWICAYAIYRIELAGIHYENRRTGIALAGSRFLYRSGLDGDSMFYGDHLDIALGRDLVRGGRTGNLEYLYRWQTLFFAGAAAVLMTLAAYVRGRAPRIAIVAIAALIGSYLLYAAVFSQAVTLHPYLFDAVLATPLILALFAVVPALVEAQTRRTGAIVLLALFGSTWLSLFQLRLYAMRDPVPQPAAVLAAPNAGRP